MIRRVDVTTPQGSTMTLALDDPESPFVVEDIQGLDPGKASIVSSGFATLDGAQYQTSRREIRNIVFRITFNHSNPIFTSKPTAVELRNELYRFFMPKSQVHLRFQYGGMQSVDISGRVESFNSPLFVREPKVEISILCFDPDFVDPMMMLGDGVTVSDTTETTYDYHGTIETGFEFDLFVDRSLSSFTIYNRLPDNSLQSLEINSSLIAGDKISILTTPGEKSITRTRSGVRSSLLYAMTPQSVWLQLYPGENNIRVYAVGPEINYSFKYAERYGGL